MKQHAFFKMINWDLLMKKLITPPVILSMDEEDRDVPKVEDQDEDEEAKFLNFAESMDDSKKDGSAAKEEFED